jgi:hypothetical protein
MKIRNYFIITWLLIAPFAHAQTTWNLTGNTGTTPGTNYVGTTDSKDLVIKTNATERIRVRTNGYVGVNIAVPLALQHLRSDSDTTIVQILQASLNASKDIQQWRRSTTIKGVIDHNGQLGLSTSTPQGLLDVNGGSTATDAFFMKSSSSVGDQGGIMHHQSSTYAFEETAQGTGATTGELRFHYVNRTAPGTKATSNCFVIRGDGRAAIGTQALNDIFTSTGNIASQYAGNFFNDGSNANRYGLKVQCGEANQATANTNYYLRGYDESGSERGGLQVVNNVFSLYSISDRRTKTNIIDTRLNALEIINKLHVVDYNWKNNPSGKVVHGFIAQECQNVYPEMVARLAGDTLGISQEYLIPVLVKVSQMQNQIITSQQNKIDSLEKEISDIHKILAAVSSKLVNTTDGIKLGDQSQIMQNKPNPFSGQTSIGYVLPEAVRNAVLQIYDVNGKLIKEIAVNGRGSGNIDVDASFLESGVYSYTLVADGAIVASKQMLHSK